MKKHLYFIAVMLLFGTIAQAQETPNEGDTTYILTDENTTFDDDDESDFDINIDFDSDDDDDYKKTEWRTLMTDIGVSSYLFDGDFDVPAEYDYLEQRLIKSTNVNIALFRHRLSVAKGAVGFEYGVTFSSNKYYFESDFRLVEDAATFFDALEFSDENYKKNRLMANYITVPLTLSFHTNPNKLSKSFNFAAGGFGGFLLSSNHKIKGGDVQKIKIKDDFSLKKFVAGVEARIGYGTVNFYAQYFLNEMFQENEGPVMNQFNVGITILPY